MSGLPGAALVNYFIYEADRRFRQDTDRRHDDFELVFTRAFGTQEDLVFPVNQDVADAPFHEGGRGAPGARVEHRHVLKEAPDKILGLGFIAAGLFQGIAPRGQVVPAGDTGGLRVRSNDGDSGFDQVAPILDALGVSFADQKRDRRAVGCAIIGKACLPVCGNRLGLLGDGIDIVRQCQRHDVGLQTVDDGACLFARSSVGLQDLDGLAGLSQPVLGEGRIELLIHLTCRVIRHVQKRDVFGMNGERVHKGQYNAQRNKRLPYCLNIHEPFLHVRLVKVVRSKCEL